MVFQDTLINENLLVYLDLNMKSKILNSSLVIYRKLVMTYGHNGEYFMRKSAVAVCLFSSFTAILTAVIPELSGDKTSIGEPIDIN